MKWCRQNEAYSGEAYSGYPHLRPVRRERSSDHPRTDGMINDPALSSELSPAIVDALTTVFDPELSVNIYDLGLIYDFIVDSSHRVGIRA
jgi:hypothetical protein